LKKSVVLKIEIHLAQEAPGIGMQQPGRDIISRHLDVNTLGPVMTTAVSFMKFVLNFGQSNLIKPIFKIKTIEL
jgi:hypothetical protein